MTESKRPIRVLFVCMGNICRSPTAQGVAEKVASQRALEALVELDSAGTHAYHVGEPPDARARAAARRRGIDLSPQRARRVSHLDFEHFDYIVAMDEQNYRALQGAAPANAQQKIRKMMEFSNLGVTEDVPDPYYGGAHGFEQVLDLLDNAMAGFFDELARFHPELAAVATLEAR